MAALTTGPLRNPGNTFTVDIVNEDISAQQNVILQGFILEEDGTRTPFIAETFSIDPNEYTTRSYYIGFNGALEFQIDVYPSNDFSVTFTFYNASGGLINYLVRPVLTVLSAITPIT